MTRMQWLGIACGIFAIGCWLVTLSMRRWIRFHRVHRDSIHFLHFPLTHFQCADLVMRQPFGKPALDTWCTDCGWPGEMGRHSDDCPRVTGERCPRCDRPKRTAHVCHSCGFAGFVIIFDLKFPREKNSRLVGAEPEGKPEP